MTKKIPWGAGIFWIVESHRWGMFVFWIMVFPFLDRSLEDNWRRLWCQWMALVMVRCGSVASVWVCCISAALRETCVAVVSSSQMSVRLSIQFTSIRTERLFASTPPDRHYSTKLWGCHYTQLIISLYYSYKHTECVFFDSYWWELLRSIEYE